MTSHNYLGAFGPEDNLDISEIIGADLEAIDSVEQQNKARTIGNLLADQNASVIPVNPITIE